MKLSEMTKDERSLLLFLETCAVDQGGLVDIRHMNDDDKMIVEVWMGDGFIDYGRIKFHDIENFSHTNGKQYTHWVNLSDEAFKLAHEERIARSKRLWNSRTWHRTGEE
jgi:hypothetical protein